MGKLEKLPEVQKRVEINLGYKCNNNCIFCTEGHNRRIYADLAEEYDFAKICSEISKFKQEGFKHITFLGGEPTIRKDFIKIVKYSRDIGFKTIFLTTNGRMLSNIDYAKRLFDSGLTNISISIHGHNADLHDTLTRNKGSFLQTEKAILNLIKLGKAFYTSTVINKINFCYLPEITKYLLIFKPKRIFYCFIRIAGNVCDNFETVVPKYADAMPYVYKAIDLANEYKQIITIANVPFCQMKGYIENVDELYWDDDIKRKIRKIKYTRIDRKLSPVKSKGRDCAKCCYYLICEGVFNDYIKKFNFDEFKPVKGKLIKDPATLRSERIMQKD